jgi:hypothetical protein
MLHEKLSFNIETFAVLLGSFTQALCTEKLAIGGVL